MMRIQRSLLAVAFFLLAVPGEAAEICDVLSPDVRTCQDEHARLARCSAPMDEETRQHVAEVLTRRLRRSEPGLDRFSVVGASASRSMFFLTGFGRDRYTLSPQWAFLEPTIRWFRGKRRRGNSFLRKRATVSGTSVGSWIWGGRRCPDCPDRLARELDDHRPAFTIVMFGTNTIFWNPNRRVARKGFFRRIAASYADPGCRGRRCLDPWSPGPIRYPADDAELRDWVEGALANKRKRHRAGTTQLVKRLLRRDVVPILTTIPPMPRRWLDEDTAYALNEETRAVAARFQIPVVDLWCALSPTVDGPRGPQLDWSHPVLTAGKGIGPDRYHPSARHAFDIADSNLIFGHNVRNTLTLLRLHELRELVAALGLDQPGS